MTYKRVDGGIVNDNGGEFYAFTTGNLAHWGKQFAIAHRLKDVEEAAEEVAKAKLFDLLPADQVAIALPVALITKHERQQSIDMVAVRHALETEELTKDEWRTLALAANSFKRASIPESMTHIHTLLDECTPDSKTPYFRVHEVSDES